MSDEEQILPDDRQAMTDEEQAMTDDRRAMTDEEKAMTDEEKAMSDDEQAMPNEASALPDMHKSWQSLWVRITDQQPKKCRYKSTLAPYRKQKCDKMIFLHYFAHY